MVGVHPFNFRRMAASLALTRAGDLFQSGAGFLKLRQPVKLKRPKKIGGQPSINAIAGDPLPTSSTVQFKDNFLSKICSLGTQRNEL